MGEGAAGACANCATPLVGAYCHACGQKAHLHHRLSHLLEEVVEGVTHFDGRLWRTLPLLAFNPGRLSREYREGRRARFVAPMHIFLFAIFLLFLLPMFTGRHLISIEPLAAGQAPTVVVGEGRATPLREKAKADTERPKLESYLEAKAEDGKYYSYKIESLAYKLAFVMAPISMAILWVLTLGRGRRWTAYDHAVVALYGLGFLALLLCLQNLAPRAIADPVAQVGGVAAALHATVHLRGAYGLSWAGAAVRAVALGVLSVLGFGLFLAGVSYLGLSG